MLAPASTDWKSEPPGPTPRPPLQLPADHARIGEHPPQMNWYAEDLFSKPVSRSYRHGQAG